VIPRQARFYVARGRPRAWQIIAHKTTNPTIFEGLKCVGYRAALTRFSERVFVLNGDLGTWQRIAVGSGYVVTADSEADLNGILDRLRTSLAAGPRRRG
jgi:hypothetical protein